MLQRDFIMRLIQMFFEALSKYIRGKENKDPDTLRSELDKLYKTYLNHPRDYFHHSTVEEIIDSFDEEERLCRVEIMATLLYQDALLAEVNEPLLRKSLALLKYVDLNDDTFSFDRQRRIGEIESLL